MKILFILLTAAISTTSFAQENEANDVYRSKYKDNRHECLQKDESRISEKCYTAGNITVLGLSPSVKHIESGSGSDAYAFFDEGGIQLGIIDPKKGKTHAQVFPLKA